MGPSSIALAAEHRLVDNERSYGNLSGVRILLSTGCSAVGALNRVSISLRYCQFEPSKRRVWSTEEKSPPLTAS